MKRGLLVGILLSAVVAGGLALADNADPKVVTSAAQVGHDHGTPATAGGHDHGVAGKPGGEGGMMCGGMMGGGMKEGGGMMAAGLTAMFGIPGAKLAVKNVDKGVQMVFTSTDAAAAGRLQKVAEAMRLMHEAMTP
jgi:hypothetical protein